LFAWHRKARLPSATLYASLCGGREAIRRPETMAQFTDTSGGPRQQAERLSTQSQSFVLPAVTAAFALSDAQAGLIGTVGR